MDAELVKIDRVGESKIPSPLRGREWVSFVSDKDDIISHIRRSELSRELESEKLEFFEAAGPREEIYYSPEKLKCGIVSCGGLCPGINDIIRELVVALWQGYGVRDIQGFRQGYRGLAKADRIKPLSLDPAVVDSIHRDGGTILSSSRGPQDVAEMVDTLQNRGIGILFTIGGDGTMRGAHDIASEIEKRNLDISVVAIPKTIDNDIAYVKRSFGFETAVQASADIIDSAHTEAKGYFNCIGLVKLMGRNSGFISSATALANRNVNYCLIPEIPFKLEGNGGLLEVMEKRLAQKEHAVIVVAEGAGQELMNLYEDEADRDASGNIKLEDIGLFLKRKINKHFKEREIPVNIKYFDPSYIIRSIPANAADSMYCVHLAQNTVHAAISGRTDMVVSQWNSEYVNIPLSMATRESKKVNTRGRLWRTVMEATHQPVSIFK